MTALDSKTISFLKVALLFGVIFVHMNPHTEALGDAKFKLLSLQGITNFISIYISYVWAFAAVPTYFLLSGYLFWKEGSPWNWQLFGNKIKSRIFTLLIPFLLWNLFSISTFVFEMIITKQPWEDISAYLSNIGVRGFWNYCVWGAHKINWLGCSIPNSGPFAIHFWFVRDLMVSVALSPLIYWGLEKMRIWGLSVLFFCYCSKIWPQIHGLGIDAIFFFAIGMYVAMNNKSLTNTALKFRNPVYFGAVLLSIVCTYFNGVTSHIGRFVFPLFAICAVWSYINIGARIIKKYNFQISTTWVLGAFFVYALHACPMPTIGSPLAKINTTLILLLRNCPGGGLIYYISSPFITASICLIIFFVLRLISPCICNLLTGKKNIPSHP